MPEMVEWSEVDRQPGVISARRDRIELAIHEAAHAVVAISLGIHVRDGAIASISEGGGSAVISFCETDRPIDQLAVIVAGNVAVQALMPGTAIVTDDDLQVALSRTRAGQTDDSDIGRALALIVKCSPQLRAAQIVSAYREAEEYARAVIERPEVTHAIELVMTVLVEACAISGQQVRRAVDLLAGGANAPLRRQIRSRRNVPFKT
jgi:hypothetical protein